MSSRARKKRVSMASDSSSSASDRDADDDFDLLDPIDDSQSSLSVSLEDMDLDSAEFQRLCRLSPITKLPAELIIHVFSQLPSQRDVLTCMLVSKAWARNSVDLLWYRPTTSRWPNLLNVINTVSKRDGFFAYHDAIKRLNLGQLKAEHGDGKVEISDGIVLAFAMCKRIERLTLPGCVYLTDLSLADLIQDNQSLMAIDISDLELISGVTMQTVADNCYKLQGLNVTGCKGISNDSLVSVAENCRRLKRLKLNDCTQLTDFSVLAFADHCHDMLEIDLYHCGHITDISVTALITHCRQLRELRLAGCSRITDEAFSRLPQTERFDALRILDLTDCNELQDNGLQHAIHATPRLRNLVLAKCRNITDRGLLAITKLGKNLHFLHLGHCGSITDYGVSHLVKYCNRIRYIDFSCCLNLTDESVALLAQLPKLKRIGLVKCSNITDRSIRALARPRAPSSHSSSSSSAHPTNNLERLHLSYCSNLTIQGIRTLLINCPQLTHLSLTGVQPFLRDDILRFCRDPPREFNDHQRDVFCVFSGESVKDLRKYLQANYPSPQPSDVDADDDDDDDDTSSFGDHGGAPAYWQQINALQTIHQHLNPQQQQGQQQQQANGAQINPNNNPNNPNGQQQVINGPFGPVIVNPQLHQAQVQAFDHFPGQPQHQQQHDIPMHGQPQHHHHPLPTILANQTAAPHGHGVPPTPPPPPPAPAGLNAGPLDMPMAFPQHHQPQNQAMHDSEDDVDEELGDDGGMH